MQLDTHKDSKNMFVSNSISAINVEYTPNWLKQLKQTKSHKDSNVPTSFFQVRSSGSARSAHCNQTDCCFKGRVWGSRDTSE